MNTTTLVSLSEIWIIDDNEIDVLIGSKTLERYDANIAVRSFTRPNEALQTLNEALKNQTKLPELIFLDLYMPLIDGWQFLQQFKQVMKGDTDSVRVIVTSSTPNEKEIPKQADYPEVIGHIIKPIEVKRLQEIRALFFA